MTARKAGRVRDDGDHAAGEDGVRGVGEIRRIDAAGIGDDDAFELAQAAAEGFVLCLQRGGEADGLRIRGRDGHARYPLYPSY